MLLDITRVISLYPFMLLLRFENDEERQIDFAEHFSFTGVFAELQNPEYFKQVRLDPELGTIVWPNGADLCPDVLYELSAPVSLQASPS